MTQLAELLAEAQARGAIGPAPLEQHVAHAEAFLDAAGDLLPETPRFLDLGSGGGLPGLVIAERLAAAVGTLLDGRVERARMLQDFVERLGWDDRVDVVGERAEVVGHGDLRHRFALVVARGFGPPAATAECAAPFLAAGGIVVVSGPPRAASQPSDRWPAGGLAELGLTRRPTPGLPWSFTVLQATAPCPPRFPRRVGVPAKRPLF